MECCKRNAIVWCRSGCGKLCNDCDVKLHEFTSLQKHYRTKLEMTDKMEDPNEVEINEAKSRINELNRICLAKMEVIKDANENVVKDARRAKREVNQNIEKLIKELEYRKSVLNHSIDTVEFRATQGYSFLLNSLNAASSTALEALSNLDSIHRLENSSEVYKQALAAIDTMTIMNQEPVPNRFIPIQVASDTDSLCLAFQKYGVVNVPSSPSIGICEYDAISHNLLLRWSPGISDSVETLGIVVYEVWFQHIPADFQNADTNASTVSEKESFFYFPELKSDNYTMIYSDTGLETVVTLPLNRKSFFKIDGRNELGVGSASELFSINCTQNDSNIICTVQPCLSKILRGANTLWISEFNCSGGYEPMLAEAFSFGVFKWNVLIKSSLGGGHVRPGIARSDVLLTSPLGSGHGGLSWVENGIIHCNIDNSQVIFPPNISKTRYKPGDILGFQLNLTHDPSSLTFYKNGVLIEGFLVLLPRGVYHPALCTSRNGEIQFI